MRTVDAIKEEDVKKDIDEKREAQQMFTVKRYSANSN
jgi:hypothetical protein